MGVVGRNFQITGTMRPWTGGREVQMAHDLAHGGVFSILPYCPRLYRDKALEFTWDLARMRDQADRHCAVLALW